MIVMEDFRAATFEVVQILDDEGIVEVDDRRNGACVTNSSWCQS